jgi:hypothetical protein
MCGGCEAIQAIEMMPTTQSFNPLKVVEVE